jgi:hypothetical protein
MNETKICKRCGVEKPDNRQYFGWAKTSTRSMCKECQIEIDRQKRAAKNGTDPVLKKEIEYEKQEEKIHMQKNINANPPKNISANLPKNTNANTDKCKKIHCTYSLNEDSIRKLEELKFKHMPARTKLSYIIEMAIDDLYNKYNK